MSLIDIFIKDEYSGKIHRVGDDEHDSLYVDLEGRVHYYNLQTGDGSNGGYRFMPSDCGELEVEE